MTRITITAEQIRQFLQASDRDSWTAIFEEIAEHPDASIILETNDDVLAQLADKVESESKKLTTHLETHRYPTRREMLTMGARGAILGAAAGAAIAVSRHSRDKDRTLTQPVDIIDAGIVILLALGGRIVAQSRGVERNDEKNKELDRKVKRMQATLGLIQKLKNPPTAER